MPSEKAGDERIDRLLPVELLSCCSFCVVVLVYSRKVTVLFLTIFQSTPSAILVKQNCNNNVVIVGIADMSY